MALSPLQEGLYSLTTLAEFADGDGRRSVCDRHGRRHLRRARRRLLRDCATKMLRRHPNLRASFFSRGIARPVQIVPSRVDLPWRTVTAAPEEVPALEVGERRRPFDLEHGPAIRFLLIELPCAQWRLVLTAHHIVIDGWSLPVFVNEMMILYQAGGDSVGAARSPRGRTGTTSAGWRVAIRKPANRSGVGTWRAFRAPPCYRPRWARPRTRGPGAPHHRTADCRRGHRATGRGDPVPRRHRSTP